MRFGAVLLGLSAVAPVVFSAQVAACSKHDASTLRDDPVVKQALQDAFDDSHVGQRDQHEEGGWIYDCKGSDGSFSISISRWPPGTYDKVKQGPKSKEPSCQLVGSFHTHGGAAWGQPGNDGYHNEKPSTKDWENAESNGVPGYIIYGLPGDTHVETYGPFAPNSCTGEDHNGAAWSEGEPHLATFDGYDYGFQAAGEFVLVRSADGALEVQARQVPLPSGHVTENAAFAFRIDGSVVEVSLDEIVVDDDRGPLADFTSFATPEGGRIVRDGGEVTAVWSDGSEARIAGRRIIVRLADGHRGAVEGLLGNWDGDTDDDLVGPDGAPLLDDGTLTYEELYDELAPAWQVTEATTLFTYQDGESPATYALDDVPGFRLSAGLLDPERLAAAEALCTERGVRDPTLLRACALDVAATADESYADETASLEAVLVEMTGPTVAAPPLVAAVEALDLEEARRLLAEGADVDAAGPDGRTALMAAVLVGRDDAVALLLDADADPGIADDDGQTVLHIAALWGFDDIATRLLDAGADPDARDALGRTPADLAQEQGHDDLAARLG